MAFDIITRDVTTIQNKIRHLSNNHFTFNTIELGMDGNCMFSCMASVLNDIDNTRDLTSTKMRQLVTRHIASMSMELLLIFLSVQGACEENRTEWHDAWSPLALQKTLRDAPIDQFETVKRCIMDAYSSPDMHWGTEYDLYIMCNWYNVQPIVFTSMAGCNWIYPTTYIDSFTHFILLYNISNFHFQVATLTAQRTNRECSFFIRDDLPVFVLRMWRRKQPWTETSVTHDSSIVCALPLNMQKQKKARSTEY